MFDIYRDLSVKSKARPRARKDSEDKVKMVALFIHHDTR